MKILSGRVSAIIAGSAIIGSMTLAGTAFAMGPNGFGHGAGMPRPAVVGTVASVSGTTLTVDAQNRQRRHATTTPTSTYTVDATNAAVIKNNATSTVSAIAVGDRVFVSGTVTGTSVVATSIRDGIGRHPGQIPGEKPWTLNASSTPVIHGNGEPVIGGNVTTVGSTTLTVATKSGITYAVDTSSATIEKANASGIATGDNVIVQGTVNGTSVVASSVIDSGSSSAPRARGGILNAIGGFFFRFFGFF